MSDYWKERIAQEMQYRQKEDTQIGAEMTKLFNRQYQAIQDEIDLFMKKYGDGQKITPAEAKKRVSEMDVVNFADKAKRYVQEKNFSPEANAELKIYNLKMKVSRFEMLQYHIDLEMVALADGERQIAEKYLNQTFVQEMNLQAGILGEFVQSPKVITHLAKAIIDTPYDGVVWSDRIWERQTALRLIVANLVQDTILRGRNAVTMARFLKQQFDVTGYQAKRLAVTETARVQTQVQKEMYKANQVGKYEFMAEPTACEICAKLDGKIFDTDDMTPGKNAAPMHPHCHCSTGPSADKDKLSELNQAHKKGDFTEITDQAIDKVPLVRIPGFTEVENRNLQESHKALLRDARDNNQSNEVMHILTGGNPVVVYGSRSEVDPNDSDTARFIIASSKERLLTVIHNHPGSSGFSMNDFNFFIRTPSVKTLTIVSNRGKVMYLTKTEDFDLQQISHVVMSTEGRKYIASREVEKLIKLLYSKGIKYLVR